MTKKKKSKYAISRRTLLMNSTALIGLPLLDIMDPHYLYGDSGQPLRVFSVLVPNGLVVNDLHNEWMPSSAGPLSGTLPVNLVELESVKNKFSVISNLKNEYAGFIAYNMQQGPGSHARGNSTYFTSALAKKTLDESLVRCGVSFDQVIAQSQSNLKFPSLAISTNAVGGIERSIYHPNYSFFSWKSAVEPNKNIIQNPRALYSLLFGDINNSRDVNLDKNSILDLLISETAELNKKLGQKDKNRLDEYLSGIRDIERKIQLSESQNAACQIPNFSYEFNNDFDDLRTNFYQLIIKAFECDFTRMVTMVYDHEGSIRTFPGMTEPWHESSHYTAGNSAQREQTYRQIIKKMFGTMKDIIGGFEASTVGGKSLLDSSLITLGSSLATGNTHNAKNIPTLIAGKGNGIHTPGKHIVSPVETPLANLWLRLIKEMGVNQDSFGDSTGVLSL